MLKQGTSKDKPCSTCIWDYREFSTGVPEHLVQLQTGHRSVQALKLYQQPSEDQRRAVTKALSGEDYSRALKQHSSIFQDSDPPKKPAELVSDLPSKLGSHFSNCTVNFYFGKQD